MEQRGSFPQKIADTKNVKKATNKIALANLRRPRSHQDNETASPVARGELEKSENYGAKEKRRRRKSAGIRSNGRIVKKRVKKWRKKSRKKAERSNSSEVTQVLSGTANPSRKRTSRRKTRASARLPNSFKTDVVPIIPKRVFKAFHLLRHEKFLRVVSRYLKPRDKDR